MTEVHDTGSLREQFFRVLYQNGAIFIRFLVIMGMFWGMFGSIYGVFWMIEAIYSYYYNNK